MGDETRFTLYKDDEGYIISQPFFSDSGKSVGLRIIVPRIYHPITPFDIRDDIVRVAHELKCRSIMPDEEPDTDPPVEQPATYLTYDDQVAQISLQSEYSPIERALISLPDSILNRIVSCDPLVEGMIMSCAPSTAINPFDDGSNWLCVRYGLIPKTAKRDDSSMTPLDYEMVLFHPGVKPPFGLRFSMGIRLDDYSLPDKARLTDFIEARVSVSQLLCVKPIDYSINELLEVQRVLYDPTLGIDLSSIPSVSGKLIEAYSLVTLHKLSMHYAGRVLPILINDALPFPTDQDCIPFDDPDSSGFDDD